MRRKKFSIHTTLCHKKYMHIYSYKFVYLVDISFLFVLKCHKILSLLSFFFVIFWAQYEWKAQISFGDSRCEPFNLFFFLDFNASTCCKFVYDGFKAEKIFHHEFHVSSFNGDKWRPRTAYNTAIRAICGWKDERKKIKKKKTEQR